MKCPYCREEIENDLKVCPICGEKIIHLSKVLKIFLILLHLLALWEIIIKHGESVLTALLLILYWTNHILSIKTRFRLFSEDKFLTVLFHISSVLTLLPTLVYVVYIPICLAKGQLFNIMDLISFALSVLPMLILIAWYWKEKLTAKKQGK